MRLAESKIKDAILHPEKLVRQQALQYFTDCFSRDTEVMPQAIQAIATYGRKNAFLYGHILARLAQTDATVQWAIRELNQADDPQHDKDRFFPNLSQLLCSADPWLVAPHADEIFNSPGFSQELGDDLRERLEFASWDADRCWQELERLCAEAASEESGFDVNWNRAANIVTALAPIGERFVPRILDLLTQKDDQRQENPLSWLRIFLVMLAGEMRLVEAVPLLAKNMREGEDAIPEECVDALARIGTDAAAEAVTDGWLDVDWTHRLYGATTLEKIHSDTTVRKCLELIPQEKDLVIKTWLAEALLGQFADEAIDPVRELIARHDYDPSHCDLMRMLVATSTVLETPFPEQAAWKREAEERMAQTERRMRETQDVLFGSPEAPPTYVGGSRAGGGSSLAERKPAPYVNAEKRVGRNDPCPCGSGRKYKKCCMGKGKE